MGKIVTYQNLERYKSPLIDRPAVVFSSTQSPFTCCVVVERTRWIKLP